MSVPKIIFNAKNYEIISEKNDHNDHQSNYHLKPTYIIHLQFSFNLK